jgi:hypothetical protein
MLLTEARAALLVERAAQIGAAVSAAPASAPVVHGQNKRFSFLFILPLARAAQGV